MTKTIIMKVQGFSEADTIPFPSPPLKQNSGENQLKVIHFGQFWVQMAVLQVSGPPPLDLFTVTFKNLYITQFVCGYHQAKIRVTHELRLNVYSLVLLMSFC